MPMLLGDPTVLIPKRPLFRFLRHFDSPDLDGFGFDTGMAMAYSGRTRTLIDQSAIDTTFIEGLRRALRKLLPATMFVTSGR